MTRKDYVAIAHAFALELTMRRALIPTDAAADAYYAKTSGLMRAAEIAADVFESDNPRFDRARFLTACGI
jgi:hypothetical protein